MEATRRDLADAAADLFIRHGYVATTVDDIARAAGVGRRTFFRHYATKEDVFLAPTLDEVADFAETLDAVPDTGNTVADAAEAMRRSVEERRDHLADGLALYRSIRSMPELRGSVRSFCLAFEDCFASWYGRRTGAAPDSTEARLFGACAVAVRETALARWSAVPDTDLLVHLDEAWQALGRLGDGTRH
jgi:AcrR family transcriptional regulator